MPEATGPLMTAIRPAPEARPPRAPPDGSPDRKEVNFPICSSRSTNMLAKLPQCDMKWRTAGWEFHTDATALPVPAHPGRTVDTQGVRTAARSLRVNDSPALPDRRIDSNCINDPGTQCVPVVTGRTYVIRGQKSRTSLGTERSS
ncbi:hypothetical protein GCM10010232_67310 [Streptomyces amakusaensis]